MNLIDAVKSGRPFRRPPPTFSPECWWAVYKNRIVQHDEESDCVGAIYVDDLLADDWEILEPEVRITRAQFVQAWRDTCKCNPDSVGPVGYFAEELAKRLGLE